MKSRGLGDVYKRQLLRHALQRPMPEKEFAFLIVVLTGKINIPALDYIAYILSAYALIICVTAILKIINFVRNGVSEHPFMKWLLSVPIVEKFIHEKNSEQK